MWREGRGRRAEEKLGAGSGRRGGLSMKGGVAGLDEGKGWGRRRGLNKRGARRWSEVCNGCGLCTLPNTHARHVYNVDLVLGMYNVLLIMRDRLYFGFSLQVVKGIDRIQQERLSPNP